MSLKPCVSLTCGSGCSDERGRVGCERGDLRVEARERGEGARRRRAQGGAHRLAVRPARPRLAERGERRLQLAPRRRVPGDPRRASRRRNGVQLGQQRDRLAAPPGVRLGGEVARRAVDVREDAQRPARADRDDRLSRRRRLRRHDRAQAVVAQRTRGVHRPPQRVEAAVVVRPPLLAERVRRAVAHPRQRFARRLGDRHEPAPPVGADHPPVVVAEADGRVFEHSGVDPPRAQRLGERRVGEVVGPRPHPAETLARLRPPAPTRSTRRAARPARRRARPVSPPRRTPAAHARRARRAAHARRAARPRYARCPPIARRPERRFLAIARLWISSLPS